MSASIISRTTQKSEPFTARRAEIVRQHAIWASYQPGYDPNSIETTFRANIKLGSPLPLKGVKEACKKARRQSHLTPTEMPPRDPVDAFLSRDATKKAEEFVLSQSWRGRFALSCLLVARALLGLMQRTGTGTGNGNSCFASCREIAEETGLSAKTAARCLLALSSTKRPDVPQIFIRHLPGKSFPDTPIAYALLPKVTHAADSGSLVPTPCTKATGGTHMYVSKWAKVPDAFRGRGLSRNYWIVLQIIERIPIHSGRELAPCVSFSEKTTRRALTRLRKVGLIEKIAGVWVRTEKSLTAVAEERGTLGEAEKQKAEHVAQREAFTYRLERPGCGKLHLVRFYEMGKSTFFDDAREAA
jgi:hypothetical protein